MSLKPLTYQQTVALDNRMIRIEFGTQIWLMIWAILHDRQPPAPYDRNKVWARDHIAHKIMEHHGYADDTGTPT